MPVALTSALPLMNTDGATSTDTDRVFRKFMAGLLLPDVKSANPLAARNGVLPHNWDANGCTTFRPGPHSPTTAMSVDVQAGMGIVERAGQGPYFVFSEAVTTIPIATSDPANPRVDVLYAWVGDQSISGGADPLHGPVCDVLTGAPSATPVARTDLPDGAVSLAQVAVAANASAITSANITDTRHSTALTGAARHLLPGDSVADVGRIDGELRYRNAVSPYPALLDYWDGKQLLWRGVQSFAVTATLPGTPSSASLVSGTSNSANTTLVTVPIADPGFPYRLTAEAVIIVTTNSGTANVYCNVNSGPLCASILNTKDGSRCSLIPTGATIFTGPSTVRLNVDLVGGATSMSWGGDVRNLVTVTVIPA